MEGLDAFPSTPNVTVAAPAPARKPGAASAWMGYLAAGTIGAVSYTIHLGYKPLSAAILAILLGALVRNLVPFPATLLDGCKGLVRRVIPITIVLTGATLNLADVAKGAPYLAVIAVSIAAGTLAALWAGHLTKAKHNTALLVGAGTSICGTSAIVAVAPILNADDEDLLLSVSTINLLGLAVMLVLPVFGSWTGMDPTQFGVWAGVTVHAVPQAVTTGFALGAQSGAVATLVKLIRVTLLAPFILVLAFATIKRTASAGGKGEGVKVELSKLLPSFIYGFAALAIANTLGVLPDLTFHPLGGAPGAGMVVSSAKLLGDLGNLLLTLSMAAMGLEVNLRFLIRTGGPALATGISASLAQATLTWLAIRFFLPQ